MEQSTQREICLVGSHGGHLELLSSLRPAYEARGHVFVTPPSAQAAALSRRGSEVVPITNPKRSPARLTRNLFEAARLVRSIRPRVVISSGAGVAVPFCLLARAGGARLIFIETMARLRSGSASGRVLYRVADSFLVQWPELRAVYPEAELCRPRLLEQIGEARAAGEGTVVATGTHDEPFDRLLRWADEAAGEGLLPGPVFAQSGPSTHVSQNLEQVPLLSPEEMEARIANSKVVVTHGGSGLVSAALRHGRRPLVMARRQAHGEHVDDHQVAVTRKIAALGLAVDLDAVDPAAAAEQGAQPPQLNGEGVEGESLERRLSELLTEALG